MDRFEDSLEMYENMSLEDLSKVINTCISDINAIELSLMFHEKIVNDKCSSMISGEGVALSYTSSLIKLEKSLLADKELFLSRLIKLRDKKISYARLKQHFGNSVNEHGKVHMMVMTKPVFKPRKEQ